MNSRERFLIALNHREPDRVPIDLCVIPAGTISPSAPEGLRTRLGIPSLNNIPTRADDPLIRQIGADVKRVALKSPEGVQADETGRRRSKDEWGGVHATAEQAWVHVAIKEAPLSRIGSTREIENYPWPDPSDASRYAGLKESARRFHREGFGVVVDTPLKLISLGMAMRGPEQFMADTTLNRPLLEYLMDKILDVLLELSRRLLEEVEEYADVVAFGGDLPRQGSPPFFPDLYRRLLKPRHRTIMRFLREHAGEAKVLYSCPGAAEPIMQDLIELGVDACSLAHASPGGRDEIRSLKARYGRDLTFWGGIPADRVLSLATPEEVKAEVRTQIEDLAPGGGFVLGPLHGIGPGVKPENVIALYEAALEYGTYR
jgi:uroporphyrinogen decarboxylase